MLKTFTMGAKSNVSKPLPAIKVRLVTLFLAALAIYVSATAQEIVCGAERTSEYFPMLTGKSVALVANHTAMVTGQHLLDTLLASGINVTKVFCPEHGFRGEIEAGEWVPSTRDPATGIPIISLYGKHLKPEGKEIADVDIVVFDIQGVGVRFYTYESTLQYIMEACAVSNKPLVLLDRPNPNGFYVDGPILETKYKSFAGLNPVPIVHGLTMGEYALMLNGEGWLENARECRLTVIPCANYKHSDRYRLPVNPSPNLRNMQSIYLYPSLGLFEGTAMSVGRGTPYPFQVFGSPYTIGYSFFFTPSDTGKKNKFIPYPGIKCFGLDLRGLGEDSLRNINKINLAYLINAYQQTKRGVAFFKAYFPYLAGGPSLQKYIEEGVDESVIRASWENGLKKYLGTRQKYLLYPDFK